MSEVTQLLAEAEHEMIVFDRPSRRTSLRLIEALAAKEAENAELRAVIHQLSENAAKAAKGYAANMAELRKACQIIADPDWTWATPEKMRNVARAALGSDRHD